jgi:hypothetical protein
MANWPASSTIEVAIDATAADLVGDRLHPLDVEHHQRDVRTVPAPHTLHNSVRIDEREARWTGYEERP